MRVCVHALNRGTCFTFGENAGILLVLVYDCCVDICVLCLVSVVCHS